MASAFALYRLPHAERYVKVQGSTQEFTSCALLNGRSGFVMAPFQVKQEQPIVLIAPEQVTEVPLPPSPITQPPSPNPQHPSPNTQHPSPFYHIDFSSFHAQLQQGIFRKIVLSRCADEPAGQPVDPEELFLRACQLYPRMFIALVYTPQSGLWLTATPEILLDGDGASWRTIALAGTMALEGDQLLGEGETARWSTKNIEEQRVVATYIAECLERFATDFQEEGPRTVRAANLVHLRSDFTFSLPSDDCLGDLLMALHPTPAVCGLPKCEAFDFIVHNEHTPRRYYSGFMGPLRMPITPLELRSLATNGTQEHPSPNTHLYVSLRCMNIDRDVYHLYAGGGLLKDSVEEQEWLETEAKLETMRQVMRHSNEKT